MYSRPPRPTRTMKQVSARNGLHNARTANDFAKGMAIRSALSSGIPWLEIAAILKLPLGTVQKLAQKDS